MISSSAISRTSTGRVALLTALAVLLALAATPLLAPVAFGQEAKEEVHYVGAHDIRVVPVNLNLGSGSAQFAIFVTHPETGAPVPDARRGDAHHSGTRGQSGVGLRHQLARRPGLNATTCI